MEKKALLTIVQDSLNIEKMLIESGGEMTDEISEILAVTEQSMSEKIDGYHLIIDRFETLKKYYEEKAEYFKTISNQCGNASKRLKENIKVAMINLGVDEIKGNDMRFVLVGGAGSLVIEDEEMIPVEYKYEKVETIIKKDELKRDLKTKKISGARIEESKSVRAYANIPERKTKQLKKGAENE